MSDVVNVNGVEFVVELDSVDGIRISNGDLNYYEIVDDGDGVIFIVIGGEDGNYNVEIDMCSGEYKILKLIDENNVKIEEGKGKSFEVKDEKDGFVVMKCEDYKVSFCNGLFVVDLREY